MPNITTNHAITNTIFSKLLHKIEEAAICFVMERGRRKSRQNSRILQYETCLTHANRGMIGKSKEFEDVGRITSSFPTYLGKIEATLPPGYAKSCRLSDHEKSSLLSTI